MSRPVFMLRLQPIADDGTTMRAVRAVLKALLRRHGLKCVEIRELEPEPAGGPTELAAGELFQPGRGILPPVDKRRRRPF